MAQANVVVITGAGGMGIAAVRRIGNGKKVVLADYSDAVLDKAAADLESYDIVPIKVDISDHESVKNLVQKSGALGRVESVVHTAGVSPYAADGRRVYQVNLLGTALVIDAFLAVANPNMSVVCIASIAGHWARATTTKELEIHFATAELDQLLNHSGIDLEKHSGQDAYLASKRANQVRVENAAKAYGLKGARINTISPGIIMTPMLKHEMEVESSTVWLNQMAKDAPAGRFGTADEIGAAVAFLCSADASYITGSDLVVDGGTRAMVGLQKEFVPVAEEPSN